MGSEKKHFIIIAGEASGDMHAAHLVNAIKKQYPNVEFSGMGGSKMKMSGVDIFFDLTKVAVVGFWEVLKHYGTIRKAFYFIIKIIKHTKVDAVILVDYPGFNLRLAKILKKMKIRVIYYISPQVWAWKAKRVNTIKKYVDKMLVLFQFEKDFYAQYGVDVTFVGHPLVDTISAEVSQDKYLKDIGLLEYKITIGLLPGSRQKEVKTHLPIMLKAAQIINQNYPMVQFLIVNAPTIDTKTIEEMVSKYKLPIKISDPDTYSAINACHHCIVSSGTATLETALLQKPMVVIYKTSGFTYMLAKLFIKIPHIGLVNVVAGKKIVPECIQHDANPEKIAEEIQNIFINEVRIADIKSDLKEVKISLGKKGASQNAAREILGVVT